MPILSHLSSPFPQWRPSHHLPSDTKSMPPITSPIRDGVPNAPGAATVRRQNEDPELLTLNAKLRAQKQRLLHWAYNWCGYCNNADEEFQGSDLSAVASSVMVAIERLLSDAEQVQQAETGLPPSVTKAELDSKVATTWANPEIARMNQIVLELTRHIDILYSISSFRKSASDHSPALPVSPDRSNLSRFPLFSKASVRAQAGDAKLPRTEKVDVNVASAKPNDEEARGANALDSVFQEKSLFIADSSSLLPPKVPSMHGSSPPPYEPVAHQDSKFIRLITKNSLPEVTRPSNIASDLPVLIEPANASIAKQDQSLPRERPADLVRAWNSVIDNAKVSHLGLLRFLGYCVDASALTPALVHQLPSQTDQSQSTPLVPRSLVSLFPSPTARPDSTIPNLEDRFHLSYALSLAVLHLRSQNILHGDLSSYRVLIFPYSASAAAHDTTSLSRYDILHPYLTAFSHPHEQNEESPRVTLCTYADIDSQCPGRKDSYWVHYLYNLGLILLEIGFWTSLSALHKDKYDKEAFKTRIATSYVPKLGAKCGIAYMKAVQLCLDAPKLLAAADPKMELRRSLPQGGLRDSCVYPGCRETNDDFSKNLTFAIAKLLFHCASLNIVSPPPGEDLVESLPPALPVQNAPTTTAATVHQEEEEPDDSTPTVGDSTSCARTIRKWANVEIPDKDIATWNNRAAGRLSKLLAKVLNDPAESCSVSLMMAGDSAGAAKPTVCITCASVRRVRAAVKKYFKVPEGWGDVVVLRGSVQQSTVSRARRRGKKYRPAAVGNVPANMETDPCYQKIPGCGASIGAYRDDQHLPPVSFGGTILVDGAPYGMTVHHMLDAPLDDSDEEDNEDGEDCSADDDSDDGIEGEDDQPKKSSMNRWVPSAELMGYNDCYTIELSDEEDGDDFDDEDLCLSDDLSDDGECSDEDYDDENDDDETDDDTSSIGDATAFDPEHDSRITVTQPALDDVREEFFPSLEDRDDEHIASHSFGHVHASSGLRRWRRNGTKHEIDWALIKIEPRRCQRHMNTVNALDAQTMSNASNNNNNHNNNHNHHHNKTSTTSAPPPPSPPLPIAGNLAVYKLNKVASAHEIGGLPVHCRGRTSGFQSGRISRAMALLKMHGRASFSSSFSVDGNFGIPGDSGAWVFDQITGQVCGHVLAWSEKSRTAYIAPMEVLFEDIARTLGADLVALPGSPEAQRWITAATTSSTTAAKPTLAAREATLSSSSLYKKHKHRSASSSVGNAQDQVLGRRYPHGLSVDFHNHVDKNKSPLTTTPTAAAPTAREGPGSSRLARDISRNHSQHHTANVNNSTSDRLKGVAATSYHNVNALIARQRTMMGRLPT